MLTEAPSVTLLQQRTVHNEHFLPTQIGTNTPGAELRWDNGQLLISA